MNLKQCGLGHYDWGENRDTELWAFQMKHNNFNKFLRCELSTGYGDSVIVNWLITDLWWLIVLLQMASYHSESHESNEGHKIIMTMQ